MSSDFIGLSHVVHLSVRIVEGWLGLLFVYFRVFLYEDEDGRMQNKLEVWWIQISDQQNAAISRNVVFVRVVASLATKVFDRLFGNKILSARAIGGSVCFSLASWFLAEIFNFLLMRTFLYVSWSVLLGRHPPLRWVFPICILGFAIFLCLGLLPLRLESLRAANVWLVVVLILSPLGPLYFYYASRSGWEEEIPYLTIFSLLFALLFVSFLCDIFFVALTRVMLRKVTSKSSFMVMSGLILLNCLMALLLVVIPYLIGYRHATRTASSYSLYSVFSFLALFNLFDALVSLVFVSLALVTILHLLFWPAINRSLYALAGLGIARRRKLMGILGVSLLALSTGMSLELLKSVLELFGGR
jgi:hypothetical protein